MRVRILLAALALAMSSAVVAPMPAFADGIERPSRPAPVRPRPARRPAPVPVAPPAPVVAPAPQPDAVLLPAAFFGASAGGVGLDIGTGYVGGGSTVIVQGARVSAISISSASASASARASSRSFGGGRGHGGGYGGGGGGCGCH